MKAAAPHAAKRKYTSIQTPVAALEGKSKEELPKKQKTTKKAHVKKLQLMQLLPKRRKAGIKLPGNCTRKSLAMSTKGSAF
jgi:hypothetical protein